jgi:hypothetical protein
MTSIDLRYAFPAQWRALLFRSCTPEALAVTDSAEKDFEELLFAVWAAQLEKLHTPRDPDEGQADPDSQRTTGKQGDTA